jgi:hypothetical protein
MQRLLVGAIFKTAPLHAKHCNPHPPNGVVTKLCPLLPRFNLMRMARNNAVGLG